MVDIDQFIRSARNSGYRSFPAALAELIDNAIDASASRVEVWVVNDGVQFTVSVMDDGRGMSEQQLIAALSFGGSGHYGSTQHLGRYGMGLPTSSLSQARRVDVVSRDAEHLNAVSLDLDDVNPRIVLKSPGDLAKSLHLPERGTAVIWRNLDRLDEKLLARDDSYLSHFLGRKFRHFIRSGVVITVNGSSVLPFDPLLLKGIDGQRGILATPLDCDLTVPVKYREAGVERLSHVTLKFSQIDVSRLAVLDNTTKKRLGIIGGAGISIVRANREIDHGWYFVNRRRQNYDDWWRGEISFSPELDELFGVSFTKQGIRPTSWLRDQLAPAVTEAAKLLLGRTRQAHMDLANQDLASGNIVCREAATKCFEIEISDFLWTPMHAANEVGSFKLTCEERASNLFCQTSIDDREVQVTVNMLHEFFERVYAPMLNGSLSSQDALKAIQVILLGLGRADSAAWTTDERLTLARYRSELSHALRTMLRAN